VELLGKLSLSLYRLFSNNLAYCAIGRQKRFIRYVPGQRMTLLDDS
jgi:hypothetical protein